MALPKVPVLTSSRAPALKLPSVARGALLAALVVLASGCPDSEAKFQEFIDNTDDDRDFMPPPPPDLPAVEADISGEFLLAISTIISPDLPMQFISTNQMTIDMSGAVTMTAELQPLALMQGKVTQPRTPVGDPLLYGPAPVVDGKFTIDAGTVMVTGMANPITGGDIVASLKLNATIISADFYCGTMEGDVMSPLMAPLMGSTFAAVRIEGPMALPLDVTKNCNGDTVTDLMP